MGTGVPLRVLAVETSPALGGPPRHSASLGRITEGAKGLNAFVRALATWPQRVRLPKLSTYVLGQMIGPTMLFTFLLTAVIWLTQALRLLDLVINRGQSAPTFVYLTILILPSLLVIILPIAFFAGTLFALYKLNADSELVVMSAAGFSVTQIAIPVFMAAGIVTGLTWLNGLYLMPAGQRAMNDKVYDIRADIGTALLNEGEFNTPALGLTVFIRAIDSDGTVEDSTNGGSRLSVLKFQQYNFDLDQFASPTHGNDRQTSERYLDELFHPSAKLPQKTQHAYIAEAHNRLSQPLYCIVFALIAMATILRGRRARGANALRISGAVAAFIAVRLAGYGVAGLAVNAPAVWPLFYLIPVLGSAAALAVLEGHDPLAWFRRAAPEET